jgi:hypothetical protein
LLSVEALVVRIGTKNARALTGPVCVALLCPVTDEAEVELGFQVAVEVVGGDQVLQRHRNRFVKTPGFGRAQHREAPGG